MSTRKSARNADATDAGRGTRMLPLLLAQRRRLLSQVTQVERDLRWFDANVEPELLEEGQEQSLAAVLDRLDTHDRAEIDAIDHALARISSGEYDRCAACGEAIPPARQDAMPFAVHCRPCAESREALERS